MASPHLKANLISINCFNYLKGKYTHKGAHKNKRKKKKKRSTYVNYEGSEVNHTYFYLA